MKLSPLLQPGQFLGVVLGLLVFGCGARSASDASVETAMSDENVSHQRVSGPGPRPVTYDLASELVASRQQETRINARSSPEAASISEETVEQVPSFDLVDWGGEALSSSELVGKQAFAVVFFASWCELCARKMKMIQEVFSAQADVKLLLVSVDGQDTLHHVPGFLREQRLEEEQVVDGLNHPRFTERYNPVSSIPLIAVVGRSGGLVEYQIGLKQGDAPRLRAALAKAVH